MTRARIEVFDYDKEIEKLPDEWMTDMAVVFREFDEDQDGKIPRDTAIHVMSLFRLNSKKKLQDLDMVHLDKFIDVAGSIRDAIFMSPAKRYRYYFQMIAGLGKKSISAVDIQRFIRVSGDDIALKFCDDFIDEFDRKRISKDSISAAEFCSFCAHSKIPV